MSRYVSKAQRLIEKQDEFYRGLEAGKQQAMKDSRESTQLKTLQVKQHLLEVVSNVAQANAQLTVSMYRILEEIRL